MYYNTGETYIT